jgi:serine/threonine protein kinase
MPWLGQQGSQQHGCVRRCLPEAQARRLFQQLIVAVDFLHHLGIANRDIKVRRNVGFWLPLLQEEKQQGKQPCQPYLEVDSG